MKWVEKSSIEKIRRLLEIFEQERHYQVLLTPKNISAVRQNPTPYTLPVIPRPLPSEVMEGEHFVIANLRLGSSNTSFSMDPVIEASSQVQGARSVSRSSASMSRGSSSSLLAPSRRAKSSRPRRLLPLAQVAGLAP